MYDTSCYWHSFSLFLWEDNSTDANAFIFFSNDSFRLYIIKNLDQNVLLVFLHHQSKLLLSDAQPKLKVSGEKRCYYSSYTTSYLTILQRHIREELVILFTFWGWCIYSFLWAFVLFMFRAYLPLFFIFFKVSSCQYGQTFLVCENSSIQ